MEEWLGEGLEAIVKKENMVNTCVSQLKKNKEELREARKPSESIINFPIITSKAAIGGGDEPNM